MPADAPVGEGAPRLLDQLRARAAHDDAADLFARHAEAQPRRDLIAHRADQVGADRLAAEDQIDPELARLGHVLKGQVREVAVLAAILIAGGGEFIEQRDDARQALRGFNVRVEFSEIVGIQTLRVHCLKGRFALLDHFADQVHPIDELR